MSKLIKRVARRFIRENPRPTEYFVARVVGWSAVVMAVATSVGLIIAAVQLI